MSSFTGIGRNPFNINNSITRTLYNTAPFDAFLNVNFTNFDSMANDLFFGIRVPTAPVAATLFTRFLPLLGVGGRSGDTSIGEG
jgi:hypothetical protein